MKRFAMLLSLATASFISNAQERLFTYTYQTDVLKKGSKAIDVWNTLRWQRSGYYRELDTRIEYELGLGHNLETAFFINTAILSQDHNLKPVHHGALFSFSNEWKLKLGDAEHHRLGSAIFEEVSISAHELKFETKLLLDKKLGRGLHALNLVHELGFAKASEYDGVEGGTENKLEIDYGLSLHAGKHLNLGLEMREDNVLIEHGKLEYSSLFAGPGLSYHHPHFGLNFTVLPQLYSFKGETSHHLNLAQHEKVETRLIFSF
ncbi:MAG: hypothetical protein H7Y13_10175 [Sphingobacteriaceae bacterium]|nr:hypothetical protein [Sphingobacteriaceae bacterium]